MPTLTPAPTPTPNRTPTPAPTTISILPDACKRDGLCAKVCPARIFRFLPDEVPATERTQDCVLCGQCLSACPSRAIAHSRLSTEKLQAIERQHPVDGPSMAAFLRQRRSVRNYRKEPISRELLESLAYAAGHAPVGAFGGDGWVRTVTVVQGSEKMARVREATVRYMRKLCALLDGMMMRIAASFSEEAKSGRQSLPDLKMRLAEWDAGRDAVTYDAPAAIFVSAGFDTTTPHEDCDAALMNIIFAAHAHGLGTCWNGWLGHAALAAHVSGPRELGDLIGIPKRHRIVEALTLGWPSVRLHSVPEREISLRWVE